MISPHNPSIHTSMRVRMCTRQPIHPFIYPSIHPCVSLCFRVVQRRKAEREERLRRRIANEFKTSSFQTVRAERCMVQVSRICVCDAGWADRRVCVLTSTLLWRQITKTDKIKAMSKKQLRQIKKTQAGTCVRILSCCSALGHSIDLLGGWFDPPPSPC